MAEEFNKSGSKYLRRILGSIGEPMLDGVIREPKIDVYGVLLTFDVKCPARQHAIKKLLCSGLRQKATELQDLEEARDAIDRAIQLQKEKMKILEKSESKAEVPKNFPDFSNKPVYIYDEKLK
jgi:hypothetical protein